jgi:hypothetical protein
MLLSNSYEYIIFLQGKGNPSPFKSKMEEGALMNECG